jgi:hypothetical protein
MLPLISFETGRSTQTQSSGQPRKAAPANGSLVPSEVGTTAERPAHAAKNQKEFTPRSPERVRRAFALLTKTYHGSRITGNLGYSTRAVNEFRLAMPRRPTGVPGRVPLAAPPKKNASTGN